MRRSILLTMVTAVVIAGCGNATTPDRVQRGASRPASTAAAPSRPLLVTFKRAIGADPLVSQLTVDMRGHGSAVVVLGGIDGAKTHLFTVPAVEVRRLKRLIERAKLVDTRFGNANHYTYWVTVHRHAWRMSQAYVPGSTRPLIHELDSLTDAYIRF